MTRRIAQTIGQANDLIHSDLGGAIDILQKELPSIDPRAIVRAMERDKDVFPRGGAMSARMWENAGKVGRTLRLIKFDASAAAGELWTNKFQ